MLEDINNKLKDLEASINNFRISLKIEEKRKAMGELQLKMSEPGFWQDQKKASEIVAQLKDLKSDVEEWDGLYQKLQALKELVALSDTSYEKDIMQETADLDNSIESLRLKILFSGRFDDANAIVEINSGAGGTEACDWASMLFRMYFRWAEEKKFKLKVLNEVRGEEAGIKNITFFVEGRRAFGLLRSEKGVHRLVRISPFDASRRRHTSFASVDVLPEIKEDIDIEIKPEEIRVDTYRASGAGGQHVNVTDSAVRITHFPTGIVVSCQNERSQHQNKYSALRVLKAKLYEIKEEEKRKELEKISGTKRKIEWGSQIRSYVLHPYLLVKDHRTNTEVGNAKGVLDGKIDEFIYAYLKLMSQE
ncbi:MAG: peptide chain release factor 2 [Candidatus Omnitrophota bacterium]|nr:MAG: peptide chain release factor 2 [Candidatus Omnitrophota bacterium]